MGARQKLNNIYVTIALIVAALAGLLTPSTFVFCIALALLIITTLAQESGNHRIRLEAAEQVERTEPSKRWFHGRVLHS